MIRGGRSGDVVMGKGDKPRILLTRLRYLGDVILTTPVISAVKKRYPSAEIYYLAEYPYSRVLLNNPALSGVLSLNRGFRNTAAMIMKLRRLSLNIAVDLFYNPRSAMLLFLSGIPVRVGGCRRIRRYLYTHNFEVPGQIKSAVDHHLYFPGSMGIGEDSGDPEIFLTAEEKERGRKIVDDLVRGHHRRTLVAMHPGGTWPAKRWPADNFVELAGLIENKMDAGVLIIHGPGEERIGRYITSRGGNALNLLPLKSIRSLASVLYHCSAVVSNDGGVMHMAAALHRPTVGIMGPTDPEIWFPYQGRGSCRVVYRNQECSPCNRHYCEDLSCLNEITPVEVYRNIEKVMRGEGA